MDVGSPVVYTNYKAMSSLLFHVTCMISSQSSLRDPLDHLHWSIFFNHQLTPVSRSLTTPSGMPPRKTGFFLLFVFPISLILHHHLALLHRHTPLLDSLLTFLVAFSILVFKLSLSQCLSLHSRLSQPMQCH